MNGEQKISIVFGIFVELILLAGIVLLKDLAFRMLLGFFMAVFFGVTMFLVDFDRREPAS